MKNVKLIILALITLFFTSALIAHQNHPASILFDESYNGLAIDDLKEKIITKFGKPDKTTNLRVNQVVKFYEQKEVKETELIYKTFSVLLCNNKVQEINIFDKTYKTKQAISIGDSIENVLKIYGKNQIENVDKEKIIIYFHKTKQLGLVFKIDDSNNVKSISIIKVFEDSAVSTGN